MFIELFNETFVVWMIAGVALVAFAVLASRKGGE